MRFRSPPVRRSSFGAPAIAFALVLALALAACGGGGKKAKNTSTTSTTRPKVLEIQTSVLKFGTVDIESAGPSVPIDPATGRAVLDLTQSFIDAAVFTPLKTGALGSGYATLFDPGIRAAATGRDTAALTDVAVGKVDALKTGANTVRLSALEGTLGELIYLSTDFTLTVYASVGAQNLTLQHNIELTFAQAGANKWIVHAYRVQTTRKSAAGTTTTTAASGGSTP